MIEMRVSDQDQVDWRQVTNSYAGLAQPFQHKQPAGKIRINDNIQAANLHKEAGVPNKCDAQFIVRDQLWLVGLSGAGSYRRVPHQPPKLASAFVQSPISKRNL